MNSDNLFAFGSGVLVGVVLGIVGLLAVVSVYSRVMNGVADGLDEMAGDGYEVDQPEVGDVWGRIYAKPVSNPESVEILHVQRWGVTAHHRLTWEQVNISIGSLHTEWVLVSRNSDRNSIKESKDE